MFSEGTDKQYRAVTLSSIYDGAYCKIDAKLIKTLPLLFDSALNEPL